MTLEGRLYAIITADADFQSTGAKLYPLEAPQDAPDTYVTYSMLDTAESGSLFTHDARYFNTVVRRYEFVVVARKMLTAESVINALLAALCGSTTPDETGQIQAVIPEAEMIQKNSELQLYARTIHFTVIGDRVSA